MSVDIPSSLSLDLAVDFTGPVEINGIPTSYHLNIDQLPKIQIGLDPVTINPITLNPVDVSIRLKEFPSVRAHIPADFRIGLSVLGFQLACIRLCGEAQAITEPYLPNPCERCEPRPDPPRDDTGVPQAKGKKAARKQSRGDI